MQKPLLLLHFRLAVYSVFVCIAMTMTMAAQGQTSPLTGAADLDKSLQSAATQLSTSDLAKGEQTPVDNVIIPELYHIGPGDVLTLHVLPFPGVEQSVMVSAENSVILPRIGIVQLGGKTLAMARDTILKIYAVRNPNATVAVSLRKSRTVYCTVRGNVAYPGVKVYPATTRISSIVALANQAPSSSQVKPATATKSSGADGEVFTGSAGLSSYVARNITVSHRDGTTENVDLERAQYGADNAADPTVREGDEIIVPFEPPSYPTISIAGAVRRPTTMCFKKGDKLSVLLRAGYGLRDDADNQNVKLSLGGKSVESVQLTDNGQLAGADIALQPGSSVIVGSMPQTGAATQGIVEVVGEVMSPGVFSITPHQTRLKEIIEKAGGFTDKAYLPLAYIVRRDRKKSNREIENPGWEQVQFTDLTFEDTSRLIIHSALKRQVASADFVKAFTQNSSEDNITLAEGDMIVIPENPQRVYVYGQVHQPGYVDFSPGKRLEWYVQRAGGYAAGAEKSLSRIIKGKNKVWVEDDDNVFVEAGDEVYIAPPTNRPAGYDIQYYTTLGTILTTVLVMTTTIYNLLKKQ